VNNDSTLKTVIVCPEGYGKGCFFNTLNLN